jgi:hypothetical protein
MMNKIDSVNMRRAREALQRSDVTVHDGVIAGQHQDGHTTKRTGYYVSFAEPTHDPGSGMQIDLLHSVSLEITREEAIELLKLGATWTGTQESEPQ